MKCIVVGVLYGVCEPACSVLLITTHTPFSLFSFFSIFPCAFSLSKHFTFSNAGLRLDGRRPADLRHFSAKIGVFEGSDGSAYVEHGNTKAFAVVYGPSEVSEARKVE